ncbi:hypothetical protein PDIG_84870 [Penicillium digitatum PHI26]|uniref:Uncharacterized protein n=2 Tax=Penicillium digitatum TaxID=36651 RepID=K9F7R7_PEND2|nr:hypothetical protein PDIP_22530 [Penicillium digitatum Pd1]EKV05164.1 hypothetical protein PDIG_84870 [Penicillium digitatum PHI26]EKV19658.1 hypothetical protein PDIP_22530 [Penicillium digitatum Pd1]
MLVLGLFRTPRFINSSQSEKSLLPLCISQPAHISFLHLACHSYLHNCLCTKLLSMKDNPSSSGQSLRTTPKMHLWHRDTDQHIELTIFNLFHSESSRTRWTRLPSR